MPIYPDPPASANNGVPISFATMAAYAAANAVSVGITSPPSSGTAGTALNLTGTVSPSGTAVQVGLSTSATVAPTSWTNATVAGGTWSASITPSSAGTYYIWAEQTGNTAISAVSGAVTVAGNSVTITTAPPSSATEGSAYSVAGTVSPSGTAVQAGWSSSNTTAPTSWTALTVSGTGWTGSVTAPGTAGTYYLWVEQTANSGVSAVSSAITVSASSGNVTITSYGSTTFGVLNPSGGLATTYSAAANGAGAGGTAAQSIIWGLTNTPAAATSPADTFQNFWIPNGSAYSSLPSSLPSSGEVGVTYGNSGNLATNYNSGADVVAYIVVPNVTGTYRFVTFQLSSTGTIKAICQTSAITITT